MPLDLGFIEPKRYPRFPSCHASTLAETADGRILAAWYAGEREGAPDVAILVATLEPGTGIWSAPRIAVATPGRSLGNHVLFRAASGRIRLLYATLLGEGWETAVLDAKTSDDGGATWSEPRPMRREPGWLIRNRPVPVASGLLLPAYDEGQMSSLALLSADDGESWRLRGQPSGPGLFQPAFVPSTGGRVTAFFRRAVQERSKRLWRALSADEGRTWSAPEPTELPNPNSGIDALRLASGAVLLAFNDAPSERVRLSLALSSDDGASFSHRRIVEDGVGELSYPALLQDAAGRIHLTYTWRREKIRHVVLDEEWIPGGP